MKDLRRILSLILFVMTLACALFLSSCGEEKLVINVKNTVTGETRTYTSDAGDDEDRYSVGQRFKFGVDMPGFEFGGIYSEPDGKGKCYVYADQMIASDFELGESYDLYFNYVPIDYTITLVDSQSGVDSVIDIITYNYFTDGLKLPTPACLKENYEFVGWGYDRIFEIKRGTIGDMYLVAEFAGKAFTVTLDAAEGSIGTNKMTVRYNESYTLPTPTAPEGTVFIGWSLAGTSHIVNTENAYYRYTENKTFVANYSRRYSVTVEAFCNGELVGTYAFDYVDGNTLTLTAPRQTGYLASYVTDTSGNTLASGSSLTVGDLESDVTYRWYYSTLVSSVTLKVDRGVYITGATEYDIAYGESFELPAANKTGPISFVGWREEDGSELLTGADGKSKGTWAIHKTAVTLVPVFEQSADGVSYIYDVDGFLNIKNDPAGTYSLMTDIDLTGKTWTPFSFSGKLYGNGNTVKGISLSADSGDLGVFLSLSGAVCDLTLEDLSVTSRSNTKVNVGGLCATLKGSVDGVTVYGSISADRANVGGIAGSFTSGSIRNSKNYASVSTVTLESDTAAGGIAGYMTSATLTLTENRGSVSGYASVGGIVGAASGANSITHAKNFASVTAKKSYAAGVVGRITTSNVADSSVTYNNLENSGAVEGENYVGGCIGYVECYGDWWESRNFLIDIYKLTNGGEIEGEANVGGCVGYVKASTGHAAFHPNIEVKLTDLINLGSVTAENNVGGCIGYFDSMYDGSKLIRSSSSATVTAKHTVGGIAGVMSKARLVSCTNTDNTVVATGYYVSDGVKYARVGGIVGVGCYIEDCHNAGRIEYSGEGGCIGGIVGYNAGTMTELSNSADIYAPAANHVGGIAGYVALGGAYTLKELENSGDITAAHNVGGVIGTVTDYVHENSNNTHTLTLSKLESSGDVTASGDFIGGVIGKLEAEGVPQYTWNTKLRVVASDISFSGAVSASSTLAVGCVIGGVSTDTEESVCSSLYCSGTLNGELAPPDKLFGSATNFRII